MTNQALPLVSIITPSFNQGKFIKETIDSVLQQDYPNIEHIVVDGGSTDDTLAILNQYRHVGDRLRFVSEPDRGQSHAINKGLAMARGDIIGWVNSDDTYAPGAVRKAVQALVQHPQWALVAGIAQIINENSQVQYVVNMPSPDYQKLFHTCCIAQPSAFLWKSIFQQMGGVDESLRFCMDYDLWIRIAKTHRLGYISEHLANARIHSTCKSATQWNSIGLPEVLKTVIKHYGKLSTSWMAHVQRFGVPWLLEQSKNLSLYGPTSRVTGMNRNPDLWVPQRFVVTVDGEPGGVHSLVVKGSVPIPYATPTGPKHSFSCTVLVNGQARGFYETTLPNFTWEIPLDGNLTHNEVTFFSAQTMMNFSPSVPRGTVSFMAQEVIALSAAEARVYHILKGPPAATYYG